jgi:hypothetical protein
VNSVPFTDLLDHSLVLAEFVEDPGGITGQAVGGRRSSEAALARFSRLTSRSVQSTQIRANSIKAVITYFGQLYFGGTVEV